MKFLEYLVKEGYKPFEGAVDAEVYRSFGCVQPCRGEWYHKPGSYQCVGCPEQCETDSPVGFQMFLIPAPAADKMAVG